jgi:uncharacterized protein (DUF983 family)
MPPTHNSSTLSSILHQRCPRCRVGSIFRSSIFRGLPKMYERCAVCGLKFEREPGYFLGAMYISYGLALGTITVLAVGLWAGTGWPLTKVVLWAVVLFLPLAPSLTLFSRVLWIYLDQGLIQSGMGKNDVAALSRAPLKNSGRGRRAFGWRR